jgi:hypothetical protein
MIAPELPDYSWEHPTDAEEWEFGSALRQAEHRIQRILIDLEEETGKRIDHVEVDTRNFAQLRTEIHFQ